MQSQLLNQHLRCQRAFAGFAPVVCHATSSRLVVCQASGLDQVELSRRSLLEGSAVAAAAAAALTLLQPYPAYAGLERYVKKKKLDPLDTYVPLVLEARERLAGLDSVMVASPTTARQLLRSGPFNGLRDNIRAVGQYASTPADEGGAGLSERDASQLVASFFRALEDYDLVLYNAVREYKTQQDKANKAASKAAAGGDTAEGDGDATAAAAAEVDEAVGLDKEVAAVKLTAAVEQLDKLIGTVPAGVLSRSREVLAKVSEKQQQAAAGL